MVSKTYKEVTLDSERQQLIVENLPFVRHVLGKLVGRLPQSVDVENLESAGVLGLVEAAHQFDPEKGISFRTFAYPRVWGAIIDEMRRNSPLPQRLMNQISRITRAQEKLSHPATTEMLAAECELTVDEVETCLAAMRLSTPAPLVGHAMSLAVVSDGSVSARIELDETKKKVAELIQELPEQQRIVLTLYYKEDLRLREIAEVLGLSESRISRVLSKAEQSLRVAFND